MANEFRPIKVGKFKLLEKIAAGGMAEVYRATSAGAGGFEKQIAIKRILPSYSSNEEFRRMFEYEARLSSVLSHANIVQIIDFVEIEVNGEQTYYLAMEFVDGKNLRQFINRARKANVPTTVEFGAFVVNEVAKGLEYAHSKKDEGGRSLGIIHRDMSPQNVMLSFEGAVKIVDFGIAKAKDKIDETRSGVIKGKFGYMSPEQANGSNIDSRSDVFSTGIILWELVTGKRLFAEENDMATLRKIQDCVVLPPSRLNPKVGAELERVILKSLTKDLSLRYQTAGELQRDLQAYLSRYFPKYTTRDASDMIQAVFKEEIAAEKRRWEQLRSQPILYSQGSGSARSSDGDHGYLGGNDDEAVTASEGVERPLTQETQVSAAHSFADIEPEKPRSSQPTVKPAPEVSEPSLDASNFSRSAAERPADERRNTVSTQVGIEEDPSVQLDPGSGQRTVPRTAATIPRGSKTGEHSNSRPSMPPVGSPSGSYPQKEDQSAGSGARMLDAPSGPSPTSSGSSSGAVALEGKADPSYRRGRLPTRNNNTPPNDPAATRLAEPMAIDTAMSEIDKTQITPQYSAGLEDFDDRGRLRREPAFSHNEFAPKRNWLRTITICAVFVGSVYFIPQYAPGLFGKGVPTPVADTGTQPVQNDRVPAERETPIETAPQATSAAVETAPVAVATTAPVAAIPAGEECILRIDSDPSGATVLVDGRDIGKAPIPYTGRCGSDVNVRLKLLGFTDSGGTNLVLKRNDRFFRSLKRVALGTLEVTLDVGAKVYLGNELLGEATAGQALSVSLPPGRQRIRFVSEVYGVSETRDYEIAEGKTTYAEHKFLGKNR